MNEQATTTKTKIKTSTKVVLGLLAVGGSIVAGFFIVTTAPTATLTTATYICEDSDGGNYPNTKGLAQIKNSADGYKVVTSAEDYCLNSTQLIERFCSSDSSKITTLSVPCKKPLGCGDRRCLSP